MILSNSLSKFEHIAVACYIALFATQIIGIEGFVISPIKVAAMMCAPLIILVCGYIKHLSDALVYGVLYIIVITLCALCASNAVSYARIGYRAMYVMTFVCVYYMVHRGQIELSFFKRIFKTIIIVYGLIIFSQYILYFSGIRQFTLLNFYGAVGMNGVFKPNGLAVEASHAARILPVLYYGLLKLTEIETGNNACYKNSWKEDLKLPSITFWVSMIMLHSATAMIGMFLIFFYLFKDNRMIILCLFVAFIILMNVEIDNLTFKRIQVIYHSFFSGDMASSLQQNEGSGAVRIMPIINTLTNLNLFSLSTWIGTGNVHDLNVDFVKRMFSEDRFIGDISDYGLISYLTSLALVYKCSIGRFFSIESLMFLCLATFSVGSVYYTWLMLIVFCIIKFYESVDNDLPVMR